LVKGQFPGEKISSHWRAEKETMRSE
jgi:hypothetical protein